MKIPWTDIIRVLQASAWASKRERCRGEVVRDPGMATWTETTGDISGDWFVISEFLAIMKWEYQSINMLYIDSYEHKHACVQGCVKAQTFDNLVTANNTNTHL